MRSRMGHIMRLFRKMEKYTKPLCARVLPGNEMELLGKWEQKLLSSGKEVQSTRARCVKCKMWNMLQTEVHRDTKTRESPSVLIKVFVIVFTPRYTLTIHLQFNMHSKSFLRRSFTQYGEFACDWNKKNIYSNTHHLSSRWWFMPHLLYRLYRLSV